MNTKKATLSLIVGAAAIGVIGVVLSACSSSSTTSTSYAQVERLGRPAVNEGLVLTNAYLNAFNATPPSLDLSTAAAPVVTEAGTVLTAIHTVASGAGLSPIAVADVVGGFLPDVMRVDTSLSTMTAGTLASNGNNAASANAAQAYAHVATGTAPNTSHPYILVGGRKLTDNVINVTLGYLFDSNATDWYGAAKPYDNNVTYYGVGVTTCSGAGSAAAGAGTNPGNPGHKCLNGQTVPYNTATWPYLAAAN